MEATKSAQEVSQSTIMAGQLGFTIVGMDSPEGKGRERDEETPETDNEAGEDSNGVEVCGGIHCRC